MNVIVGHPCYETVSYKIPKKFFVWHKSRCISHCNQGERSVSLQTVHFLIC